MIASLFGGRLRAAELIASSPRKLAGCCLVRAPRRKGATPLWIAELTAKPRYRSASRPQKIAGVSDDPLTIP